MNDMVFDTVTARLSGWIWLEVGVTTTVYDPSGALLGTLIVPINKPSGDPDIVVFDAIAVPAEFRNSMVTWTPGIGFNPLVERIYPVTLSWVPGCTESPELGVEIAVNPCGGGWTFTVMFAKLLLSWATPPSLIVLSGSTMSSRGWTPTVLTPTTFKIGRASCRERV